MANPENNRKVTMPKGAVSFKTESHPCLLIWACFAWRSKALLAQKGCKPRVHPVNAPPAVRLACAVELAPCAICLLLQVVEQGPGQYYCEYDGTTLSSMVRRSVQLLCLRVPACLAGLAMTVSLHCISPSASRHSCSPDRLDPILLPKCWTMQCCPHLFVLLNVFQTGAALHLQRQGHG